MNLIEKMHAIMVSNEVNIWHYPMKVEGQKFYYWLANEPENQEGHGCYSLDGLVEAAYKHIDPLSKTLPKSVSEPELLDIPVS